MAVEMVLVSRGSFGDRQSAAASDADGRVEAGVERNIWS